MVSDHTQKHRHPDSELSRVSVCKKEKPQQRPLAHFAGATRRGGAKGTCAFLTAKIILSAKTSAIHNAK